MGQITSSWAGDEWLLCIKPLRDCTATQVNIISKPKQTFVQKLGQINIMEDSWLMNYMSEDGHDRNVSMEPKQCCHCQRAFQINLGKFMMVICGHFSCASQRWSITESLPLDLMAPAATGQGGKLRSSLSSFNAKSKQKIACSSCLTWINLSNHAVQSCTLRRSQQTI